MSKFVPEWVVKTIDELNKRKKRSKKKVNELFYDLHPHIPKRTIQRWTKSYFDGDYTTKTIKGHFFQIPSKSIVPSHYSQLDDFSKQREELRERCRKEKRHLRIVNSQDDHINKTDPALISLRNDIVSFFDPDIFPVLLDSVDNTLISPHGTSYYQSSYDVPDEENWEAVGVDTLIKVTDDYLKSIQEVVDDRTLVYQGSSNHFDWVFKLLAEAPEFSTLFWAQYFDVLKRHDTLWVEPDRHRILPLTDKLLFMHGTYARKNFGTTGNAYLRKFSGNYSICAGHSHRRETIWTAPIYGTQERFFANICGTLGDISPDYTKHDHLGHGWSFSLISVPPDGMKGAIVEEVDITIDGNEYVAYYRGKKFSIKKTVEWEWERIFNSVSSKKEKAG